MLKKTLVASCLLVASMSSQATIISYDGYQRENGGECTDAEKVCKYNIVTDGKLEWLMWDVTKGMSIDSSLDFYKPGLWRLASNSEMEGLFSVFFKSGGTWDLTRFVEERWEYGSALPNWLAFSALFGANISEEYKGQVITWPSAKYASGDVHDASYKKMASSYSLYSDYADYMTSAATLG